MTVKEASKLLEAEILSPGDLSAVITGVYAGDLLSFVMSRIKSGNIWLTVMGNVNTAAVAVLAEVPCIALCEDAPIDTEALKKAEIQGVTVIRTPLNIYEAAVKLAAFF